ncbi:MAG: hypothetical protein PHV23_02005 [Candidatus Gracilibacteria bacterium]|nr:hypothetical protein [Candidatus Gracilibacteria bacterium]
MIYAVKNDGETNEKMILRYKKLFFQSRIANKIRTERYAIGDKSKKKIRHSAIVREHYRMLNNKVYF